MSEREAWMVDALCRDHPTPDWWFPHPSESAERAISVCRVCPVRDACLDWALAEREPCGVWGGVRLDGLNATTLYRMRARRGVTPVRRQQFRPHIHGTTSGYRRHQREDTTPCEWCAQAHMRSKQGRDGKRRDAS